MFTARTVHPTPEFSSSLLHPLQVLLYIILNGPMFNMLKQRWRMAVNDSVVAEAIVLKYTSLNCMQSTACQKHNYTCHENNNYKTIKFINVIVSRVWVSLVWRWRLSSIQFLAERHDYEYKIKSNYMQVVCCNNEK